MQSLMAWIALGVAGVMVGSFLNVVIHRLPRMIDREESGADGGGRYDLAWPPSGCPSCGRRLRAWELVPVLSFAMLRGRCAGCSAPVSWRYPVVELLGGALPVIVGQAFADPVQIGAAALFAWFAIAVVFTDFESLLVPDALSLPLLWAGLLYAASGHAPVDARTAIVGAAAGYLCLRAVGEGAERMLRRPALGGGDVKLFAALGAWLGWAPLGDVLFMAAAVGTLVALPSAAAGRLAPGGAVPFGPFLSVAGLLVLVGFRPLSWLAA